MARPQAGASATRQGVANPDHRIGDAVAAESLLDDDRGGRNYTVNRALDCVRPGRQRQEYDPAVPDGEPLPIRALQPEDVVLGQVDPQEPRLDLGDRHGLAVDGERDDLSRVRGESTRPQFGLGCAVALKGAALGCPCGHEDLRARLDGARIGAAGPDGATILPSSTTQVSPPANGFWGVGVSSTVVHKSPRVPPSGLVVAAPADGATKQRDTGRAMSQENVKAIYRLMDAFNAREFGRFLDQCDPEIELHSRFAAVSGIYRGYVGLRRWHLGLIDTWEYIRMEVEDLIDVDNDTIFGLVVLDGRGRVTGVDVHQDIAHLHTLRAGKVARIVTYTDRAEALEALGLRE
jgi:ketosteroid isomerase-like protein